MSDTPRTDFLQHDLEDWVELAQHANVYGKRLYRLVFWKEAARLERDRAKLLAVAEWYAKASGLELLEDAGFSARSAIDSLEIKKRDRQACRTSRAIPEEEDGE